MTKITHRLARRVNPYMFASKTQWAVLTVEDGAIVEVDYCDDHEHALATKKRFDAICRESLLSVKP